MDIFLLVNVVKKSKKLESKNKISKKLIIFSSFEDSKSHEDSNIANQDPVERLRQTVKLIKAIYSEELAASSSTKKINFIRE
ncbi:MAG: hypothetical protein ABI851_05290 [Saprospiraceae bacterium]